MRSAGSTWSRRGLATGYDPEGDRCAAGLALHARPPRADPLERLLRTALLPKAYSARSEHLLMAQMRYDLSFRWSVDACGASVRREDGKAAGRKYAATDAAQK
jgi:hypothetical protein